MVELGLRGWTAVAAKVCRAVARDGEDHAVGCDLADPVVAGIGDEDVAEGVYHDALRMVELGLGGRTAVATEACVPGLAARVIDDDAVGADLADPVVVGIGDEDEDVALGVHLHRDTFRMVELGLGGRTSIAYVACLTILVARDEADDRDLFEHRGAAGEVAPSPL